MNVKRRKEHWRKPIRTMIILLLAILVVEFSIHLAASSLGGSPVEDGLLDGLLVVVAFCPVLYKLVCHPMVRQKDRYRFVREERDRFFALSIDLLCVAGIDGRFKRLNPAFLITLGYSEADLVEEPFIERIHPDDHTTTLVEMYKLFAGIPSVSFENRYLCKDGSYKWLAWTMVPDLEMGLIYGIARDITGKKQALAKLHQTQDELENKVRLSAVALEKASEELEQETTGRQKAEGAADRLEEEWEEVFQSMSDPAVILDRNRRVVSVNRSAAQALGQLPEELTGKFCYQVFHRTNGPSEDCPFSSALASGQRQSKERELDSLGGVFLVSCAPLAGKDGSVERIIHIATNITKQKREVEALRGNYTRLHRVLDETVNAMATALEMRDAYTAGHQRRVAALATAIAGEMGLPPEQTHAIQLAGFVHDIGKISVPSEILSKPGSLNDHELALIQTHPLVGYEILKGIEFPWPLAEIVLQHHERVNGTGYPRGLADGEICLEAKIVAVADVIEAMSSARPYRPALGLERALAEVAQKRGILYSPEVVDASLRLFQGNGMTTGEKLDLVVGELLAAARGNVPGRDPAAPYELHKMPKAG